MTDSRTYTISIEPAHAGMVTATSSDGGSFTTTSPLLEGARYWLPAKRTILRRYRHRLVILPRPVVPAKHHRPCRQARRGG